MTTTKPHAIGGAPRECICVDDAADGVALTAETCKDPEPVNPGTGYLPDLIVDANGFQNEIRWDGPKPDGQPRRALDAVDPDALLASKALTEMEAGLRLTVECCASAQLSAS